MAKRQELIDEQWALIADLFPAHSRGGRWSNHRTIIDGVMWRLRTGVPWLDLPDRYGPRQTVCHRFNAMRCNVLLEQLQARLNIESLIDDPEF